MTSTEATLLSGSPERALMSILDVMVNLKEIYRQECEAMRKRDLAGFLKLQPSKELYTRDYELLVKEIQARTIAVKKSDNRLRERVIAEQSEMKMLADESLAWCNRMTESLRRVQTRILEAARQSLQKDKTNYGANGAMDNGSRAPATSINEAC